MTNHISGVRQHAADCYVRDVPASCACSWGWRPRAPGLGRWIRTRAVGLCPWHSHPERPELARPGRDRKAARPRGTTYRADAA